MPSLRTGLFASVATAAILAGGLIAPAPASADPQVGACYAYKPAVLKDASTSAPVVDCNADHTAETFWVGAAPSALGLPSKASPAARLAAGQACSTRVMNAYVGMPDRVLPSRFRTVVLFPTDAQWNAGERWVRCDVVLQGGVALKSFTGTASALVAANPSTQFDFCTPAEPNAKSTYAYPCLNPKKNWIKLLDKDLGGPGSKFPGSKTVERKTRALCKKQGKAWSGGIKYYGWWAIWPTSVGWREGRRAAQCFVPYQQYQKELARRQPASQPSAEPAPPADPNATTGSA
ncbi:MAG: hypothetical protein GC156_10750 [Actinomycetales bacterium]|nr:hypothetical protein [Actinomycetales bacterium]